MRMDKAVIPVTWLAALVPFAGFLIAATLYVARVNYRLERIERFLGIPQETASTFPKPTFLIEEAQAAAKGIKGS